MLQIAIGIITGLTLGASFVITLLVGLVLTFGVTALLYTMPQLGSPSPAMVDTVQQFANGYYDQSSQASNWTSWANAFSYWELGTSSVYAARQLHSSWNDVQVSDIAWGAQAAAFAFSMLSVALAFIAEDGGGMIATDSAIVRAAVSVLLEIPGLAKPSPSRTLDIVIFGLDATTVGVSIAELHSGK